MVLTGQKRNPGIFAALIFAAAAPLCRAGDDSLDHTIASAAPLEIPHTLNLQLDEKARKRNRRSDNVESLMLPGLPVGLRPVVWPKDTDLRARMLTPSL